jgi:flagellar L-ring protein precursor FlgH
MRRWLLALTVFALTALSVGRADSLWERRDDRYAYLFKDTRARSIGDVVTITITENTVVAENDVRNLNRTTNGSGSVTIFDRLRTPASTGTAAGTTGTAGQTLLQAPTQTTSMTFAGTAATTSNQVFTDTVAATVVDVLPNGNLVIEGYRNRVVQGEERTLRFTGVVRQYDIRTGNVVPSTAVANFRISYLGRGPATRTTKQGFLTRINSLLRPF